MKTRRAILFILMAICSITTYGQIKEVQIGVNGLTCSQCTRSVEMSIRKLPFVQEVEMNLEHTNGKISFKPDAKVDIEQIAQAVYNAGFSVRELQATMQFDGAATGQCSRIAGDTYVFLKSDMPKQEDDVIVKFIGEQYLLKKEYKNWKPLMKNACGNIVGKVYYVSR